MSGYIKKNKNIVSVNRKDYLYYGYLHTQTIFRIMLLSVVSG